ncbi:MAG: hypothetical protein U0638_10320 [Phycisphaerales bacterium]
MSTSDEHDLASLRAYLAERDVACPSCGYNLRGLQSPACPECNQALKLQVGLVEPRLGQFLTGLIGLTMGFGFCFIVGLWGLVKAPRATILVPLAAGVLVLTPSLWLWIRARAGFRRASDTARTWLVIAAYVLSAIFVSWFLSQA